MHAVKRQQRKVSEISTPEKFLVSTASLASLEVDDREEAEQPVSVGLVFAHSPKEIDHSQLHPRFEFAGNGRFRSSWTRMQSFTSGSTNSGTSLEFLCTFDCAGSHGSPVWLSSAPPKLIGRMREKLVEYYEEGTALSDCRTTTSDQVSAFSDTWLCTSRMAQIGLHFGSCPCNSGLQRTGPDYGGCGLVSRISRC